MRAAFLSFDGVLFNGVTPIPHSKDLIECLKLNNYQIHILTNTSKLSSSQIREALSQENLQFDVLSTGAEMAASRLKKLGHSTIAVLGTDSFCEELKQAGFRVITFEMHEKGSLESIELFKDVTAVLVGEDTNFNIQKAGLMSRYCYEQKCELFAVGPDRQFPSSNGRITPGAYPLAVPISVSSYAPINVIGKPNPDINCSYEEVLVIGDNPKTDIVFANRIGAKSVLTLTGITEDFDPNGKPAEEVPTLVAKDIQEVIKQISEL